jgi:hypothetical protein
MVKRPLADGLPGRAFPLLLVWLACLATGVTAWLWNGIDAGLIARADDARWDESLLLPHQDLLWLACNGAFLLSLGAAVTVTASAVRARRPGREAVTV